MDTLLWGTYGKGGVDHCAGRCSLHNLRWIRLTDADTEHLQAILKTQRHVLHTPHFNMIHEILRNRDVAPEVFSFEAEQQYLEAVRQAQKRPLTDFVPPSVV